MEIFAIVIIYTAVLIGALIIEARMFIDAHNKSIIKVVGLATEETENILKQAVASDGELIKALTAYGTSADTLAFEVRDTLKRLQVEARRPAPVIETVPKKAEQKELNKESYMYALLYAKDNFATSPVERKALDGIINRIKETV